MFTDYTLVREWLRCSSCSYSHNINSIIIVVTLVHSINKSLKIDDIFSVLDFDLNTPYTSDIRKKFSTVHFREILNNTFFEHAFFL